MSQIFLNEYYVMIRSANGLNMRFKNLHNLENEAFEKHRYFSNFSVKWTQIGGKNVEVECETLPDETIVSMGVLSFEWEKNQYPQDGNFGGGFLCIAPWDRSDNFV